MRQRIGIRLFWLTVVVVTVSGLVASMVALPRAADG